MAKISGKSGKIEKYRSVLLGLSVLVVVGLVAFMVAIQMGKFGELTDKGQLELTQMASLDYPNGNPGFLACDKSICPVSKADLPSYTFKISPRGLRQIFIELSDVDPDITLRDLDMASATFDFEVKVPKKPFPDVMTVKIDAVNGVADQSILSLYSRTLVGSGSDAANAKRLQMWVKHAQIEIAKLNR